MPLEKFGQFLAYTNPVQTRNQQLLALGSSSLAESREHFSELPATHFVTLLIADFSTLSTAELADWTSGLIAVGSRYFCAWGNRCELAHEVFDRACISFESDGASVIMTTDHRDESLEEAIWFALNCAVPAPPYDQNWNAILAVSINDALSLDKVRDVFAAPVQFCDNHNP